MMGMYAIIGGTGLEQMDGVEEVQRHLLETPFGKPSSSLIEVIFEGKQVLFLSQK